MGCNERVYMNYEYVKITENDESDWNDITEESCHLPKRFLRYLESGTNSIKRENSGKFSLSMISDFELYL